MFEPDISSYLEGHLQLDGLFCAIYFSPGSKTEGATLTSVVMSDRGLD